MSIEFYFLIFICMDITISSLGIILTLLFWLFIMYIYGIIWMVIISLVNKLFWFTNVNLFLILLKDFIKIFVFWIIFIILWVYLLELIEYGNLYNNLGGDMGILVIIIILFILTFSFPLYKIHKNWRRIIIKSIWKKDSFLLLNFKIYACIFIVLINVWFFAWLWIYLTDF